jgi:MFS transporter, DHA1 family, tetracycline resistance protein
LKSPLAIIFITIFLDLLGFGLILPALPFYAESYGASYITIGLLSMSYSLMQFVFAPMWGRLSDRFGRRPILLISLSGSSISFLIFGFADSLVWLFVARAMAGVLSSASLPTAQAFIADSTLPEDRAKGMGLIGAAFGLGFIFGPVVGGLLTEYGYGFPAFVAAALSGGNFIWAWIKLPETLKTPGKSNGRHSYLSPALIKEALTTPTLVFLASVFFVHIFAFSGMESTFALFCEHRAGLDAFHVGVLLGEVGIIAAVVQGLMIGRLTRRFGEVHLTHSGLLLMGIGLLATTVAHSLVGMIVVMPLYALGSSLLNPSLASLLSRSADKDKQGMTMGVAQGFSALGRVFGPPSSTAMFQWISPAAPYFVGAALLLGSLIATLTWLGRLIVFPIVKKELISSDP